MPIINSVTGVVPGGNGSSYKYQEGIAAFTTTAATDDIPVQMHAIESVQFTWLGTPATDEEIFVSTPAPNAGGLIIPPASGKLTVGRTGAAKTSGLKYSFRIRGR